MEQLSFDKAFVMNGLEGRKMIDFVTTRERERWRCMYVYIYNVLIHGRINRVSERVFSTDANVVCTLNLYRCVDGSPFGNLGWDTMGIHISNQIGHLSHLRQHGMDRCGGPLQTVFTVLYFTSQHDHFNKQIHISSWNGVISVI